MIVPTLGGRGARVGLLDCLYDVDYLGISTLVASIDIGAAKDITLVRPSVPQTGIVISCRPFGTI